MNLKTEKVGNERVIMVTFPDVPAPGRVQPMVKCTRCYSRPGTLMWLSERLCPVCFKAQQHG